MKNYYKILSLIFILALISVNISACGVTSQSSVADKSKLSSIKNWKIDLKYNKGATITEGNSTTNINTGNSKYDLELKDNIVYEMKLLNKIKLDNDNYQGLIYLVTERFKVDKGFVYVTAYFEDTKNNPIAKLTINNGGTKLDSEEDQEFAVTCARKINNFILGMED